MFNITTPIFFEYTNLGIFSPVQITGSFDVTGSSFTNINLQAIGNFGESNQTAPVSLSSGSVSGNVLNLNFPGILGTYETSLTFSGDLEAAPPNTSFTATSGTAVFDSVIGDVPLTLANLEGVITSVPTFLAPAVLLPLLSARRLRKRFRFLRDP